VTHGPDRRQRLARRFNRSRRACAGGPGKRVGAGGNPCRHDRCRRAI